MSLLEDREGNIWVATFNGLNRLVPHKMTPVINLGVTSGIEEAFDGGVWVGAVDALLRFERGGMNLAGNRMPFTAMPLLRCTRTDSGHCGSPQVAACCG